MEYDNTGILNGLIDVALDNVDGYEKAINVATSVRFVQMFRWHRAYNEVSNICLKD